MPKVPKIRCLNIFAISPEKHVGEVDFLPANQHKSFLQVYSIILGLLSRHAQSTYFIFVSLRYQGKCEIWTWSFAYSWMSKVSSNWKCVRLGIPKLLKTFLLKAISLQYLKKELSVEVDFLHAEKHQSLLQIDSITLMGDVQAFPRFILKCSLNITQQVRHYFVWVSQISILFVPKSLELLANKPWTISTTVSEANISINIALFILGATYGKS